MFAHDSVCALLAVGQMSVKAVIFSMYFPVVHMTEIEELKEKVRQLEEKVLSGQRQTRLALARAVSVEIEADKVAVLEQQLSQTKTDLEKQICMNDQAAEQWWCEMHLKEQQFNQEKAGLQHEIQVRDQVIAALHQEAHQMKESMEHQTEVSEQGMASAQQQFNHHVKALEHQIEVRKQARVALEMHIQANDREKADLEQQPCQKKEQIKTKQKEKAVLEQQLHQRKEHGPPELTEMQPEESSHVTAQGTVPSVHQLLEAREEVRTKEEELRQVREEHEAVTSRLTHDSTAKPQEMEFEFKAQILEADHDRDDVQQQLKAKDIAISSESQHNQHRIEALTDENKEMTARINSLEAKLVKVESLEGISSQEIDQLREELMDKEVEIDYLRKQRAYTTPTTTATSSPLCT